MAEIPGDPTDLEAIIARIEQLHEAIEKTKALMRDYPDNPLIAGGYQLAILKWEADIERLEEARNNLQGG